jgi:uncharacterized integral membrane protein (TIGR00697 family)
MTVKKNYKYYELLMAAFVTVLLCANLIGVHKVTVVDLPFYGPFIFGAGVLFFPISYLFGDILTEVYGYARSRRVIWAGFGALLFAAFMSVTVVNLPVAPTMEKGQVDAIDLIFGSTPRIVLATVTAFAIGEFVNSFVLAKMKILTAGRFLWTRTIGSTVAGETADSLVFYPVAFYGTWSNEQLISVMIGNYLLKVLWEVLATPFTYKIIGFLKSRENEDYYDRETDFTPFSLDT